MSALHAALISKAFTEIAADSSSKCTTSGHFMRALTLRLPECVLTGPE